MLMIMNKLLIRFLFVSSSRQARFLTRWHQTPFACPLNTALGTLKFPESGEKQRQAAAMMVTEWPSEAKRCGPERGTGRPLIQGTGLFGFEVQTRVTAGPQHGTRVMGWACSGRAFALGAGIIFLCGTALVPLGVLVSSVSFRAERWRVAFFRAFFVCLFFSFCQTFPMRRSERSHRTRASSTERCEPEMSSGYRFLQPVHILYQGV